MINKLERPERIEALSPYDTLKKFGLRDGMIFADIGSGTGIFTFAAAEITREKIYAIDISEEMRNILHSRKKALNADNIDILSDIEQVPSQSCDMMLLCTVLHEIYEPDKFLRKAKEALKSSGAFAVIEFHKRETSLGPPTEHRISEDDTLAIMRNLGFTVKNRFTLTDTFYCLLFETVQ